MQAGERLLDIAPRPAPEQFRRRCRAGPDGRVEVLGAGLLGPEQVLAAENKFGLVVRQVRGRVEGVGPLPGLEGVAPAVARGEVADPAAVAAILGYLSERRPERRGAVLTR